MQKSVIGAPGLRIDRIMCNDLSMTDSSRRIKPTDLCDAAEASSMLGISRATLTRWVRAGRVEPVAMLAGGSLIFHREDVARLADERGRQQRRLAARIEAGALDRGVCSDV